MPSVPHTFSPGTVIESAKVNENFAVLASCLDATGGDVTGTITPSTDNTIDLGSASKTFRAIYAYAVKLADTDHTHFLSLVAGSNLTANRTLTFVTGDADRTLTLGADSSISGTAYVQGGTDVAMADGGTGASLSDPGADRLLFWDDSGTTMAWLTLGTGLAITGTTINATNTGLGGSTGSTDNRLLRADGTGGSTVKASAIAVDDSGNMSGVGTLATSDTVTAGGRLTASKGVVTTPSSTITLSTGNNNDVSIADAAIVPVDGSAGSCVITGMTGGVSGRVVMVVNVGSQIITFAGGSTSSTAGNRFSSDSVNISAGKGQSFVYLNSTWYYTGS